MRVSKSLRRPKSGSRLETEADGRLQPENLTDLQARTVLDNRGKSFCLYSYLKITKLVGRKALKI